MDIERYKNSIRHQLMVGFSDRIRKAMRIKRITQLQLSSLVSVTQPEISYYCSGKAYPRLGVIQQLAFHLNVSYTWLKYGTCEPYSTLDQIVESFHSTFQERLICLLWTNNSSPVKIAKELDCSSTIVSHWCEGDRIPTDENCLALARYFNVKLDWLTSGVENFITYEQASNFNISEINYIKYLKQELRYDELIN